jgi:membrane-associated phospholipid phosphatase
VHGSLHHDPPHTPHSLLTRHHLGWVVAAISISIGVLAAVDGGSVLLLWDRPIQEWVVANRTDRLEMIFRAFSRMGSNIVVFAVFAVLVALVARRCRALAIALAVAVLARSPLEYIIKEAVDRERPDILRLLDGTGPSHPSGHVLAAVTLWGLLPPLVALVTDRRWLWWLATAVAAILITGIAASRVYLGVHWFSDIIQGLLLGWLYLALIEQLFAHHHRQRRCAFLQVDAPGVSAAERSPS